MSRELVQMTEENSKIMQLTSCVTRCDNVAPIIFIISEKLRAFSVLRVKYGVIYVRV